MLKEFIPFIDKDRYLIIQLFEFLNSQSKTTFSTSEIQHILHVSSYKTKTTIQEAVVLSKNLPKSKLIFKNDFLQAFSINHTTLNTITNMEARESLRFKIFLHITLNPSQQSDKMFQKNVGVSPSTYFRVKKMLLQEIGDEKITRVQENEIYARYYIYQVIFYFSYFDYYPENLKNYNTIRKAKNSITYLTTIWNLRLTNSKKKQINYFTFVNLLRLRNHKELSEDDTIYLVDTISRGAVLLYIRHLMKEWYMLEKKALIVARYFITFLINTNNLPVDKLVFIKNYDVIKEVSQQQVNLIQQSLNIPLNENNSDDYKNNLIKINAKILSPFFKLDLFLIDKHCYQGVLPLHTSIDDLIKGLINSLFDITRKRFNDSEIKQIEKTYMLITMPKTINNDLTLPIHIVVDFYEGGILNDYVVAGLKILSYLNIIVDTHVNNLTDIYITDTYDKNFKKQQLIWEDLPNRDDWKMLHNLIINLRKQSLKFN